MSENSETASDDTDSTVCVVVDTGEERDLSGLPEQVSWMPKIWHFVVDEEEGVGE